MNLRILIGGFLAAALAGAWTAFALTGNFTAFLPPPLRVYALQACSLGFITGGLVLGSTLSGRWFLPGVFGATASLPGITIPLLLVATQGIHHPVDLMVTQFLLPALTYATMGAADGMAVGLGTKRSMLIGAAFASGIVIGPLIASVLIGHLSPWWGVTVSVGAPWITGALALAGFAQRPVHPD